jgi:hypothetical protein
MTLLAPGCNQRPPAEAGVSRFPRLPRAAGRLNARSAGPGAP